FFVRNEGGPSVLYRMADPDAPAEKLQASRGVLSALDADATGRRLSFLEGTSARPSDVWIRDGGRTWQVTRSGSGAATVGGEMIRYRSGHFAIHALVQRPPGPRAGPPPPCVVVVHGGPNYQTRPTFELMRQALAQAGFVVLSPNYRGSTGYGRAFEDANNKDW